MDLTIAGRGGVADVIVALDNQPDGNKLRLHTAVMPSAEYVDVTLVWEQPAKRTGTREEIHDRSERVLLKTTLALHAPSRALDGEFTEDELQALLWAVRNLRLDDLREGPYAAGKTSEVGYGALSRATNQVERQLEARINPRERT